MCEPTTIAAVLAIGSQVIGHAQQERRADNLTSIFRQDQALSEQALTEQQEQVSDQAEQKTSDAIRKARIERARLRVASGEAGLGQVTAGRITDQPLFDLGMDISRIEKNRKNRTRQIERKKQSNRISTRRKVASLDRPSLIGTGLKIGTTAAAGASAGAFGFGGKNAES